MEPSTCLLPKLDLPRLQPRTMRCTLRNESNDTRLPLGRTDVEYLGVGDAGIANGRHRRTESAVQTECVRHSKRILKVGPIKYMRSLRESVYVVLDNALAVISAI
jgi:hypothetical protein